MRKTLFILLIFISNYSFSQVNLQTGAAQQSLSLFDYSDSRRGLALPITLNYNSGNGLIASDIASCMGTGWNLMAGGVIMRIQKGEPDDQKGFEITEGGGLIQKTQNTDQSLENRPPGYLYNNNLGHGCSRGLHCYPVFKDKEHSVYKEHINVTADQQQDEFVFNFNGHSGSFIIGRDWKAVSIGQTKANITIEHNDDPYCQSSLCRKNIRTTISGFTITTEDGIKYSFREISYSRIMQYRHAKWNNASQSFDIDGSEVNTDGYGINKYAGFPLQLNYKPFVVDAWYLSEIENTNNHEKITFQYDEISINKTISGKSVSHDRKLQPTLGIGISNPYSYDNLMSHPELAKAATDWNSIQSFSSAGTVNLYYQKSERIDKRISKIILSSSDEIRLTYSSVQRVDLPGSSALVDASYYLNNKRIKSYTFTYGYFYKNIIRNYSYSFNSTESKFARLCLQKLQKKGWDDNDGTFEPPYQFSYYLGTSGYDIVPGTNFLNVDHFGYYNGSNSGIPIDLDQDFNLGLSQLINSIVPNNRSPYSGLAKNGLLKEILLPTGGVKTYEYDQNRTSNMDGVALSTPILACGVSVSKLTFYNGESHTKDIIKTYKYIIDGSVNSSRWGDETPAYYSLSHIRKTEDCTEGYKYAGVQFPEQISGKTGLSATTSIILAVAPGVANILVSAFVFNTAFNAGAMFFNYFSLVISIVEFIINCTADMHVYSMTWINNNNTLLNGLPVQFSRVEVSDNSQEGGKTVYEFTKPAPADILVQTNNFPYVPHPRVLPWAWGLPKKTTVIDATGKVVSEKETTYAVIQQPIADNNNNSCFCFDPYKDSQKEGYWVKFNEEEYGWDFSYANIHSLIAQRYHYNTGRSDISTTSEKLYKNNSIVSVTNSSFVTDPSTLLPKLQIDIKEADKLFFTISYYPTDYDLPVFSEMLNRNLIHVPVTTEKWMANTTNGQRFLVSSTVTDYQLYTFNGVLQVRPYKVFEFVSKQPVAESIMGIHNRNILINHPEYFTVIQQFIYNNNGDLVEVITPENRTSNLYNYHKKYIVSSVLNADAGDVSYSSFEGDEKGNWSFNPSYVTNNIQAITGKSTYLLQSTQYNSAISRNALDPSKSYILTYWMHSTTNGNVLVNNEHGEILLTKGDWKLYKHDLTNTGAITITGDAYIDELRLFPKGSLMSTTTYFEGVGKTDECDANNRVIYYEYDGMGRLKLLRDQDRNIIKTYEYNFKQ